MPANEKLQELESILRDMESLVVAFSGGVDSTFLLATAHRVLGERVLAVTATSSTYVDREFNNAKAFCEERGIRQRVIVSEELDIPEFRENSKDRCYYCKFELFHKLKQIAYEEGLSAVADGSNRDDEGDYRPGLKAAKELLVISPLRRAGLGKEEIRELSKEMGLPTWNKPALACLASRFPYGMEIDAKKLAMVEQAENILFEMGFHTFRVRHHGDIARIEVAEDEIEKLLEDPNRQKVISEMKKVGFLYVTMDMQGYRTGSMNEVFSKEGNHG